MSKPGSIIGLPKPDKRYKPGKIVKDAKGKYRGHPDTVTPKPFDMTGLNPPIVVSNELADFIKAQGQV